VGQKKAFHNPYFNNSANAFPRHQLSETQTKKASAFNPDTPRDKMIRCKMLCGNNTCGQRSRRLMRASAHIAMSGILSVQIGLPRAVVEAGEGGPPNPIKVLFSPRGIYLKDEDKGDAVLNIVLDRRAECQGAGRASPPHNADQTSAGKNVRPRYTLGEGSEAGSDSGTEAQPVKGSHCAC